MKKLLRIMGMVILSLVVVGQVNAGYNVKNYIQKTTGTGQIWANQTRSVKSIVAYSPNAGTKIAIYNADISTGPVTDPELEFEIGISTNCGTIKIPLGVDGVDFRHMYVASSDPNAVVSVVLDY